MDLYRPRGTLARVIHAKFHNDNFLENIDTRQVCKKNKYLIDNSFFDHNYFMVFAVVLLELRITAKISVKVYFSQTA